MMMRLEEHLNQLPKHSADVDVWDKIDQQLSTTTTIAEKLPLHKADSDLWYDIEKQLKKRGIHRLLRLRYISAAASIAVIMTLGSVYFTRSTDEQIFFTEEVYIQAASSEELEFQEINVLENCNEFPAVCSSPEFTQLKSKLDQQKREELKLRDLKKATNDPNIELYHSRIVKSIQQVEAQMIQLFS